MPITMGLLLALSALGRAHAATVIGKSGTAKPDLDGTYLFDTTGIDRVSANPVRLLILGSVFWLILGSSFGVMASFKLHWPDWTRAKSPLSAPSMGRSSLGA